jgi:8-oxo-dGTP diphosphatase
VKVAVAVIIDEQHRVLITQRPVHKPHGGRWEFPGGKLENDESAECALVREIREELGIDITQYQLLGEVHHQYPDNSVNLIIFLVTGFTGIPCCLEGQTNMQWVMAKNLNKSYFPEANHNILDLIDEFLSITV